MKCPPAEVNLQYETTRNVYVTDSKVSTSNCIRGTTSRACDMALANMGKLQEGHVVVALTIQLTSRVSLSPNVQKTSEDQHLRSHNVRDAFVHSESKLLLGRAGMYVVDLSVFTG